MILFIIALSIFCFFVLFAIGVMGVIGGLTDDDAGMTLMGVFVALIGAGMIFAQCILAAVVL